MKRSRLCSERVFRVILVTEGSVEVGGVHERGQLKKLQLTRLGSAWEALREGGA